MNKITSVNFSDPIFQSIGLNEPEVRFYVAALKLGKSAISKIAREAQLNRSSAYTIAESLGKKGLVSRVKNSSSLCVMAVEPKKLFDLQDEQRHTLAKQIEELQNIFTLIQAEPHVQFYEGKQGLKNVLNSILEEAKEVCVFGDGDAFRSSIPGWSEQYSERRSAQKIRTRLLLKASPQAISAAKYLRSSEVDEKKAYTKIRLLPESLGITGGFDVFNNKVILYSFEERHVAVVIENKMISSMLKAIFEMIWNIAENYDRTLIR